MTAPGTVLPAGADAPPTTTHKAKAAVYYSLVPVLLGALLDVLLQAGVLFPDLSSGWKSAIALAVVALSPFAAYFGVFRTPNKLLVPVTIGVS